MNALIPSRIFEVPAADRRREFDLFLLRLAQVRLSDDRSPNALAEALGIHAITISHYRNRPARSDNLHRLIERMFGNGMIPQIYRMTDEDLGL